MVFGGTGQVDRQVCSPSYPGRVVVRVTDSTATPFVLKVKQRVEGGAVLVGSISAEGGSVDLGTMSAGGCMDLALRHQGPGPSTYRVDLDVVPVARFGPRDSSMALPAAGQADRKVCVGLPGSGEVTVTLVASSGAAPVLRVRQRVEGGVALVGTLGRPGSVVSVGGLVAGGCFDLSFRNAGTGSGSFTVRFAA